MCILYILLYLYHIEFAECCFTTLHIIVDVSFYNYFLGWSQQFSHHLFSNNELPTEPDELAVLWKALVINAYHNRVWLGSCLCLSVCVCVCLRACRILPSFSKYCKRPFARLLITSFIHCSSASSDFRICTQRMRTATKQPVRAYWENCRWFRAISTTYC